MKPEIHKMLVLSTGHLSVATCDTWLHLGEIVAYEKGDYGWLIPTPEISPGHPNTIPNSTPSDLLGCIGYAHVHGCSWIMFDHDAPTIGALPVHIW